MKRFIFYPVLLLLVYSCGNGDVTEPELIPNDITVHAVYVSESNRDIEIPDVNSNIYIYYDAEDMIFITSKYEGNGKFVRSGKILLPDQTAMIGEKGYAVVPNIYTDKYVTIIVESNHYPGRLSVSNFTTSFHPIRYKIINNP